jgi:hypothetical protein
MDPADPDKKKEKKSSDGAKEEVEVMHFKLRVKGGKAYVGDKAQSPGEDALRKKYGEKYEVVKQAFEDALGGRKAGKELNDAAFKMYEEFRPTVSKGQKGWGRKGELDLDKVKEVVSRK